MKYSLHSFRFAENIMMEQPFKIQLFEIINVLDSITDDILIEKHESFGLDDEEKLPKSLSRAINQLIKEGLVGYGWNAESAIFQDTNYQGDTWRLDFAKGDISIEVAFNHASVIAWNLMKPVLASELNHVEKAIQTQLGVIICATQEMKEKGGFDSAIGTYEKFQDYLKPLGSVLTTPILLIGLEAPEIFQIEQHQLKPRKKIGRVLYTR
ncbi:BglII/BstYI family type II restriction endonuclease [Phaeocystidibacter luteus]|uniref:Restriction endonuclease n=1 Tax=Phaeocystidibacter luteus TaxID=911197 RepID=A0A6N6RL47_9FLAO|nr:BglII/BstYI family type II restriction endonuclease [Phaeocystidibacter luteus]KAB2810402.1 hypothetical protein F8C67_07380 [Phaeocystidibacter luteus]